MHHFKAILVVLGLLLPAAVSAQSQPVVIELYTSQGCSSCPPADEMLHELAARDDVIALALHVDYWDYIGWEDKFAQPHFTARQQGYARAANSATIYTPQMVIGGVDHVIGSRPMQVMDVLQAHAQEVRKATVTLTRNGAEVNITAQPFDYGDYLVQLVRYLPEETVDIRRGENAGLKLTYTNIVTSWDVIGEWDGVAPLAISAGAPGAQSVAVIIQQDGFGPIVGAAALR